MFGSLPSGPSSAAYGMWESSLSVTDTSADSSRSLCRSTCWHVSSDAHRHVIGSVSLRLGGPSKAVLEMSEALTARGHEVHVVTTSLVDRGSWAPVPRSGDLQ